MQGFGATAKSTDDARSADPAAIVVFHQADLGEVGGVMCLVLLKLISLLYCFIACAVVVVSARRGGAVVCSIEVWQT
jgi:hypothetical protein